MKFLTLDKVVNFITCIGASIVIIGALMKIIHAQNADMYLTIGLVTEASIFCMYAFMPPKKETQPLNEFIPKRVYSDEPQKVENVAEFNAQVEKLNKNLSEMNNTFEKIRNLFK